MLKVDSWLRLLAWLIVLNRFTLGFVLNFFSNSRLSSSPVFQNFQGLCMIQSSILKVLFRHRKSMPNAEGGI